MMSRLRRLLAATLAFTLIFGGVPLPAHATIFELEDNAITTTTNPGAIDDYESVWREGWGNSQLPEFEIKVPQPNTGDDPEPAITGAYYYVSRPSAVSTMHAGLWPLSYHAWLSNKSVWPLRVDIPSEVVNPGPLFNLGGWAWPPAVPLPARPYEGPFETWFQFYAKDTTTAAVGGFSYGIDVTPPFQVTGLKARPGIGAAEVGSGWLTQSRVVLSWDDKVYDELAGTGYFELFVDGQPYPSSADDDTSRRVFDLKEHYPGYGDYINTTRSMSVEDLPAGVHTLQVRAVDRATNEGPLSDPVEIKIDPDMPEIAITAPAVDGEEMGARPTFSADVSDRGGVAGVGFYVDGVLVSTDTVAPYTATANLSAELDGSTHTLRVVAVDQAGRSQFADKTFVIDKDPIVSIISPSALADSPELISAKVSYADKTEVTSLEFFLDGTSVATYTPRSDETTTGTVIQLLHAEPGVHTLRVDISNSVGGFASATSNFAVDSLARPALIDYLPRALDEGESLYWYDTGFPSFPPLDLTPIADPIEILYDIDRDPMDRINVATPNQYYSSFALSSASTHYNGLIDQTGVYLSNTAALSGLVQMPDVATDPIEGVWYTHALARNAAGDDTGTHTTVYGVDVTDPSAVTGLQAYRNATTATPATGWLNQNRIVLRWNGTERDALSGTESYRVYVDGVQLGADEGTIAFQPGRSVMSVAIEDLTPGRHKVTVTAVDRAGNESEESNTVDVLIFSTPTVSINNPTAEGSILPTPAPLRATVRDAAGIDHVEFRVDGTLVKTFTPAGAPSTYVAASYATLSGGDHTLTVTAYSVSGPTTSASRTFKVDPTLPPDVDTGGSGDTSGTPEVVPAMNWFNTAYPTFMASPSDEPTTPVEMLYLVDRSSVTPIDPANPNLFYSFFDPEDGSTYFNGVIDQRGVYMSDPLNFDGELQMPGRVYSPLEGIWYIHAMLRDAEGAGSKTANVAYGVDLTDPQPVTGVAIYPNVMTATPVTNGWIEHTRAVIRWSGAERDALSGVEYYLVQVDDEILGLDKSIGFQRGRDTMSLTIEDLSEGKHTVKVFAVDRAGNMSAQSTPVTIGVDMETPKVSFVTPASGALVGKTTLVKVNASDDSGISRVDIYVDGVKIGPMADTGVETIAGRSFQRTLYMDSYMTGSHIIEVKAYDGAGLSSGTWTMPHVASAMRYVVLDKTAPKISSISGAPDPFYPRKRDGYKDDFKVKFYSSEAATMKLYVKNSSGKTVRVVTKKVAKGYGIITWNGKYTDGSVHSGTFKYALRATDSAGNASALTSYRSVRIRFYELVRTSTGSIRVVAR